MITKEQAEELRQLVFRMQDAQYTIDRAAIITGVMYSNARRTRGDFLSYIDSITEVGK